MRNIDELVLRIKDTVDNHNLGEVGKYRRWNQNDKEMSRELGINEYGCADAANILYQIGYFISNPEERKGWIDTLQSLQNPETGLYTEATHHTIHTTAHCISALELFDARPLYPVKALHKYLDEKELYNLLDSLDWKNNPWPQSHQGAGLYVSLLLSGAADINWIRSYFNWLDDNADPETGMFRKGCVLSGAAPVSHSMGGTFHYVFNMENHKRALKYPEKLIDTCLDLYYSNAIRDDFGICCGFLEIDWVYCITRALRQSHHRPKDCKEALVKFEKDYLDYLYSVNYKTDDGFNDLHMLFGATCALAELASALPSTIETTRPLKLVLDRRPFI